jgi:hypothetical protein
VRRIILVGLGVIVLISPAAYAGDFKPGSEPTGFRGISWGTEIGTLSGFKLIRQEDRFGGLDVYSREGDKLEAWSAPVGVIEYFFRKGKFFRGNILTAGIGEYRKLRQAVFAEFGVGELNPQFGSGVNQFTWTGKISSMILQIETEIASGSLLVSSREMEDRMMEEEGG